jgi:hypothetical protein
MAKKLTDVVALTRRTLEPAWTCGGDKVAEWVCPDGRRLGEHTGTEVRRLANEIMHRAKLHLRRAKRLARAAKTVDSNGR